MKVRTHVLIRIAVAAGAVATLVTAPSPAVEHRTAGAALRTATAVSTVDDLVLQRRAQERASRSARRQALVTARRAAARQRQIAQARKIARLKAISAARRRAEGAWMTSSAAWARSPEAIRVANCESGGDIRAVNGKYMGKWQMDADFWRTYGGLRFASSPLEATEEEQDYVAWRGWQHRGWEPWTCAG